MHRSGESLEKDFIKKNSFELMATVHKRCNFIKKRSVSTVTFALRWREC